jgi:hypothetical protein
MKRQKSVYMNAKDNGFGIAEDTADQKFVVTAPSYTDLLTLTRGRSHCNASDGVGADMLKNDIWSGNKIVVRYDANANPIEDTVVVETEGGGIQGDETEYRFLVEPNGSLHEADLDVSYNDTTQYKNGNKAIPMSQFRFPHRVALP